MKIIGLMSGTSVDSIDAACVEIGGCPGSYSIVLHCYTSHSWEPGVRNAIIESCRPNAELQRITALNFLLGEALAKASIAAAREAKWDLASVDAIASHGQTIWHQPAPFLFGETGLKSAGTMQIGEPAIIAARTGCCVVADFRAADMAAGGQGAPLVPFADYALFSNPNETRAVQNIGGIGNVTYLQAGGKLDDVIAFDTGPGNMLMDGLVRLICGQECDRNGAIAGRGEVNQPLLQDLLNHPYFSLKPPKTTGREQFGADMAQRILQASRGVRIADSDLMSTVCSLTAESIAQAYRDFLDPISKITHVILGGGGTHNLTLVSRLKQALSPAQVTFHEDHGINSDAKEAIAFALLAYETLNGRPSNVPSATGASSPAILGKIVKPYQRSIP